VMARATGVLTAYNLTPGTLPNQAAPPPAPTGLTALVKGTGSVQLSWALGSSTETRVRL